jgi:hypothetical protein
MKISYIIALILLIFNNLLAQEQDEFNFYRYQPIKYIQNNVIISQEKLSKTEYQNIIKELENDLKKYPNNSLILNYLASFYLFLYQQESSNKIKKILFDKYQKYSNLSWEYQEDLKAHELADYLFDYAIINSTHPDFYEESKTSINKITSKREYINLLTDTELSILHTCLYFFAYKDKNKQEYQKYEEISQVLDQESFNTFLPMLNLVNNNSK